MLERPLAAEFAAVMSDDEVAILQEDVDLNPSVPKE
jgi:hypothetical protein